MESAREARRRKILERGSDRLAMITSSQARSDIPSTQRSEPEKRTDVEPRDENPDSSSTYAAQEETAPLIKENFYKVPDGAASVSKFKQNSNSNVVTTREDIEEEKVEREETQMRTAPPTSITPPDQTEDKKKNNTKNVNPWIFSPAEVGQAISDTEIIRLVFVMFYTFFVIKGFISSKPLLLLLLTDIAILVGFLVMNKNEVRKDKKKTYNMPVDKLGLSIEVGILAQKVLGAIVMDSCIYAVIVICGMGM